MYKYHYSKFAAGALLAAVLANPTFAGAASSELDALKKRVAELEDKTQKLEDAEIPVNQSLENKLKISSSITELKIYGDVGLRYQYDQADAQVDVPATAAAGTAKPGAFPNVAQRSRLMFKLRLFADVKLGDQFFAGFGLSTNPGSDLNFQPFTQGYDKYGVYITKAFLGWQPNDWFKLIVGKQDNPFYTTDLVWDPDIFPQGVVETVDIGKALFPDSKFSLQLIGGQLVMFDNNEFNLDHDAGTEAWQFVEQLKATYKFNKDTSLTFAPGFTSYTAGNLSGLLNVRAFSAPQDALPGGVHPSGETRDMAILTAPGDFSFKLFGLKTKAYWDFAYNAEGTKRFNDIYSLAGAGHSNRDDIAWLAGLQFGDAKKAGDWSLFANYREVGMSSIDPNTNDSDVGLSCLNIRAIKVGAQYLFTDAVSAAITYSHAWNLRENLVGGQATGGAGLANLNNIDVLQVDFNMKF